MPPPTLPAGAPPPGFPACVIAESIILVLIRYSLPTGFRPPFAPPFFPPTNSTLPPGVNSPGHLGTASPSPFSTAIRPPPTFVPQSEATETSPIPLSSQIPHLNGAPDIQPPKDGVMWPDVSASPVRRRDLQVFSLTSVQAEKRAQQPHYRYLSPTPDGGMDVEDGDIAAGRKRKAAADFL